MIYVDKENNTTVANCETCENYIVTNTPDGVIPSNWMTGQLWMDISLSDQKQIPICFCPDCRPLAIKGLQLSLISSEE